MPTERKDEAAKPKNETTYVVLEGSAEESEIVILGDTLANGPEQAVRRVVPDREGKFVAIPARNWTIVDQESETPPPVITQTISKWAGLADPEPQSHAADAKVEDAPLVAAVEDLAGAKLRPSHPADEIEDDGA